MRKLIKMSLFVCKYAALLSIFFPMLCAAETPVPPQAPISQGSTTMDTQQFPVQTFDLNSEEQIKALFELHKARKSSVNSQAALGIHGILSISKPSDLPNIMKTYERLATRLSVFEIRFTNDVQTRMFVPISAQKRHLKIILSGNADTQTDVTGISFALYADQIHVHHLKWGDMGVKPALAVGARNKIELNDLTFSNNTYSANLHAEPRLIISSFADDGQFTDADIHNLAYIKNISSALFFIDNSSLEKIGTLTFDHLTLDSNQTTQLGIDASAAKATILKNITLTDHTNTPAFVQRTSLGEVIIDSNIKDDDYKYIPLPKFKDMPPKPIQKK
ncbi:MAG: hypothetical protein II180_10780 [Proteobacteria bacterium]|nr:hypothetical protein [Pseudomonadota bacterium]